MKKTSIYFARSSLAWAISFPEPTCLLVSTKTRRCTSGCWPKGTWALGTRLLKIWLFQSSRVLVLTKRHVGSGNEIELEGKSCAVGMRNAILRNHRKIQRPSVFVTFRNTFPFNPFTPKSDLIDFTLSNARRFYSSKGDPSGVKGLKVPHLRQQRFLRGILIGSKMCSFFIFSTWLLIGWFKKRLGDGLCIRYKNLILRSYS